MKTFYISILLILISVHIHAQKPLITDTSYKTWSSVSSGKISNDGNYVCYTVHNKPVGKNTVIISSTDKTWEIQSTEFSSPNFTEDSRYLFFKKGNDTLIQLKLKTKEIQTIPLCIRYELFNSPEGSWLIYSLKNIANSLFICNLRTGNKFSMENVNQYIINENGIALVVKLKADNSSEETMQWVDLHTGKSTVIYRGKDSSRHIFDPSGRRMAFLTDDRKNRIWYYNKGSVLAVRMAGDSTEGILNKHEIETDAVWRFSKDGERLFFTQSPVNVRDVPKTDAPTVWNYRDAFLVSRYKKMNNGADLKKGWNLSVLDIKDHHIRQLLKGTQTVDNGSFDTEKNDYLIVQSVFGSNDERPWNKNSQTSYYLCNITNGEFQTVKENSEYGLECIELSPDNHFLVYYDPQQRNYFSYNIRSRKTENISQNLSSQLKHHFYDRQLSNKIRMGPGGISGWLSKTNRILIQGTYDLFLVDLENTTPALNLTQNIGEKNEIIFSISTTGARRIFLGNEDLFVGGVDANTKAYHIFQLNIKKGGFKKLSETNSFYARPYAQTNKIKKAKYADSYLIQLEKTNESANYFFTKDFKTIAPLSNNYPEKRYNWFTSERITYQDHQGNKCEGLLYKQENFDSTQKYPVIIQYYLETTDVASGYLSPDPSSVGINIPLLVSNGYLMFIPNIYQTIGRPGESALNSVLAGVDYLSKFEWVDSARMGICGHSLGGYETNYIVTHSNRFAAAISESGISNWVGFYNEINWMVGLSAQAYVKFGGGRMTNGLDEIPSDYSLNSPILATKNVKTPLLIMHNDGDLTVSVSHSLQLFVQLRSLQKPVWLVQYNGEDHIIQQEKNQIDFQVKVMGFFNHYLKGKAVPEWMDRPISPN
jgi:dipeptidyl aminopeptidase/acylaminoacyl peptidase